MIPIVCFVDILKKMTEILPLIYEDPKISLYSFNSNEIGLNLFMLALSGVFYLALCIMIDMKIFRKIFNSFCTKEEKFPSNGEFDSDVVVEQKKVSSLSETEILKKNLVTKSLSKFYGNFLAVNQLSFCVDPGECFGL